ncbi:MAG: hypothetical protein ACP5OR_01870 [Candidatus Dormibacteria bacterium]
MTRTPPPTQKRLRFLTDPHAALVVAALLLCFYASIDVLQDPDLWWHLQLGNWTLTHLRIATHELFSYPGLGYPLVDHEWLPEVLFAIANHVGGLLLVAVFAAAITMGGFIALYFLLRERGTHTLTIGIALACAAMVSQVVLGSRPQVTTFTFSCLMLLILEQNLMKTRKSRWLLPLVMLVWANSHAGFLAGFGIMGITVVAELISALFTDTAEVPLRLRRLQALLLPMILTLPAAWCNPRGPYLMLYAIKATFGEAIKPIVEWNSPNFHFPALLPLLFFLGTTVLLGLLSSHRNIKDAFFAWIGITLVLLAVRNTTLAVAFILPAWATMLDTAAIPLLTRFRIRTSRTGTPAAILTSVLVLLMGMFVAGVGVVRAAVDGSPSGVGAAYPSCITSVLSHDPQTLRIFAPYGIGGFIIWKLWPHAFVYEYGESISLGDTLFNNYLLISQGSLHPSALDLLHASHTNVVITSPNSILAHELQQAGGWIAVAHEQGITAYVHGTIPNLAAYNASCPAS